MWPFKTKIDPRQMCSEFYNTEIFSPRVQERNRGEVYWDGAFRLFETFDPAVTTVDKTLSQIEFKAMFLELFSLAWTHRVHRRDLILLQELFSRSYAESTNSLAVWEAVTEYNRSVSDSADTERIESKRETIATLTARGTDATVAERTVNRLATEYGWKSGATAELLAATFLARLGLGATSWALDSVHEVIASMYKRGDSAIKTHKFVVEE